ncbi:MAG: glucuronate isomerase, partial [Phototrophicaceae bacterium]
QLLLDVDVAVLLPVTRLNVESLTTPFSPISLITGNLYWLRLLQQHGIPPESLGIRSILSSSKLAETDVTQIWNTVARVFPSLVGTDLAYQFQAILRTFAKVNVPLNSKTINKILQQLYQTHLSLPILLNKHKVQVLGIECQPVQLAGIWKEIIVHFEHTELKPILNVDALLNPHSPTWHEELYQIGEMLNLKVRNYVRYIQALEALRLRYKAQGGSVVVCTLPTVAIEPLPIQEANEFFNRALNHELPAEQAERFSRHLFLEMVRMCQSDGMTLHARAGFESCNLEAYELYGDKIAHTRAVPIEYSQLRALLPHLNTLHDTHLVISSADLPSYGTLAQFALHSSGLAFATPLGNNNAPLALARYIEQVIGTGGNRLVAGYYGDSTSLLWCLQGYDDWKHALAVYVAQLIDQGMLTYADGQTYLENMLHHHIHHIYHLTDKDIGTFFSDLFLS